MARRFHKSFTDYMVLGVTPALLIVMIASLAFYLIACFYGGSHDLRLKFIAFMFVMGSVLITRIAIEEGKEYASLFAFPLGGAVFLAAQRFVQLGALLNIALIAVIWWSAHKLTWDSTVIDDDEGSTGEGLLETLQTEPDPLEATTQRESAQRESETQRESATGEQEPSDAGDHTPLWKQWLTPQKRPHNPGKWVIYFALGSLPLLALGNLNVQEANRGAAFRALALYVAAALSVLLATSFLGLRKYLRQRRLEMPLEMAGVWLACGLTMIGLVMLCCLVLPRPGVVIGSETTLWQFGATPLDQASNYSQGSDAADTDQGRAGKTDPDSKSQSSAAGKGKSDKSGGKGGSGKGKGGSQGDNAKSQSGRGDQGKGDQRKSNGGSSKSPAKSGDSGKQTSGDGGKQESGDGGKQKKSGGSDASKQQGEGAKGDGKQSSKQDGKKGEASKAGKASDQSGSKGDAKKGEDAGDGKQDRSGADASNSNNSKTNSSSGRPFSQRSDPDSKSKNDDSQKSSQSDSSQSSSSWTQTIRSLPKLGLRVIYWIGLILVIAYLLIRYREEVVKAWQQFVEDLKRLWERLFGGAEREAAQADQEAAAAEAAAPETRFSDFVNPFATDAWRQQSAESLVRYSFAATEAWARERGCARGAEQTPLEFARALSVSFPDLSSHSAALGQLYTYAAYAPRNLPPENVEHLRSLWEKLGSGSPAAVSGTQ